MGGFTREWRPKEMTRAGSFNGLGVVSGEEITRFVCMDFWAPYSLFLLIRMSSFLLVHEGHFHLRKQVYLPLSGKKDQGVLPASSIFSNFFSLRYSTY